MPYWKMVGQVAIKQNCYWNFVVGFGSLPPMGGNSTMMKLIGPLDSLLEADSAVVDDCLCLTPLYLKR
jgi:hypothetical protein